MPQFHYQAVTPDGEARNGLLEGSDEKAVIAQIQARGLIPISVESGVPSGMASMLTRPLGTHRGGHKALLLFTQQLAALMQAGIALDRALEIMTRVSDDPRLQAMVEPVQEGVRRGVSLSRVMAETPDVFSGFYVNMVQAAEVSGDIGGGLARLADYLERSKQLRDQVVSALVYPVVLVAVAAVSLLIILTYVIPQFQQLFSDMGQALPLSTRVVIGTAEAVRDGSIWLLPGLIAAMLYWRYLMRDPVNRMHWHHQLLRLPLLGGVNGRIQTARFARSLGTLVKGGVPLLSAMGIARDTLTNSKMAQAVAEATEQLKEGKHLAQPLLASGLFPALALQMIQVGEETGQLDEMLLKVADLYDREVSTSIQRMLSILTPALIVGLGVVIAGIIMSILVAIMSINDIPI